MTQLILEAVAHRGKFGRQNFECLYIPRIYIAILLVRCLREAAYVTD